ncbi:MAG: UbiA family prenyltransferase, partial [Planctomycetes bacterium]|nr:UbiA family prenyltransferase [Planctomycetota bacterium]
MRIRPYLELIRPPNLVTAAADPLTGFLLAGGSLHGYDTIIPLVVVSVCLYGAGVALNDVCDAQRDRASRRERPIPSGRVERRHAARFAVLLFAVGLTTAWITAPIVGCLATGLMVAIVSYDSVLKRTILGPGAMGLCRTLNLALGLCAIDPLPSTSVLILPAALLWLYVASVTLFARTEGEVSKRPVLIAALVGLTTAIVRHG